ncbi:MAG TPA: hypothetical protein VIV58_06745 [Kofleriaceae bacterium]
MSHSLRLVVCLALAVFSGCLGSDTDHTQPVDTGVLGPAKLPRALVTRIAHEARTEVITVSAPELCEACTVTVEPQPEQVIIFDDRDGSVLGMIPSKSLPAM